MPTPEEDAAINRGIAEDPDTCELDAEEFARLGPFGAKRMGGPPKENPKEQVSVRYDADIVAAFRASGDGWQTRMNDALRTCLAEHPLKEPADRPARRGL
ncbi:BrnA antitoxin family protein [Paraburkholderia sp. HD33-4]|uniref:BrnA antitoxin family protein n=1 Tax=Paraburkholderia sp. HD33-4 TaxID=2883242 RepID=UPI001F43E9F4|nr:BrnA antitoxin family protein [Paraburkholderia sp. HD33-4]